MDKLFDTVLELSWQAGLIALAVIAVRLVLRKKGVPPGTVHAVGAGGTAAAAAGEPDGGKPGELTGRGSAGEPGIPRHAGGEDKRPGGRRLPRLRNPPAPPLRSYRRNRRQSR